MSVVITFGLHGVAGLEHGRFEEGLDERPRHRRSPMVGELGPDGPVTDAGCRAVKLAASPCDLLELAIQTLRKL